MNKRKERMTWKRLLSSILAVAMLITLLPIGSLSVSAEEGSNTSTASGDATTPQNCTITIVGINGDTYGDYQVLSGSNIEFSSLWSYLNNNGKSDFLYGTINGEAQIATKVNVDFGNDGNCDETCELGDWTSPITGDTTLELEAVPACVLTVKNAKDHSGNKTTKEVYVPKYDPNAEEYIVSINGNCISWGMQKSTDQYNRSYYNRPSVSINDYYADGNCETIDYLEDTKGNKYYNYNYYDSLTNAHKITSDLDLTASYVKLIPVSLTSKNADMPISDTSVMVPEGGYISGTTGYGYLDASNYGGWIGVCSSYFSDGRQYTGTSINRDFSGNIGEYYINGINYAGTSYKRTDKVYVDEKASKAEIVVQKANEVTVSEAKTLYVPQGGSVVSSSNQWRALYPTDETFNGNYNSEFLNKYQYSLYNFNSNELPYKEGYIFDGWSIDEKNATNPEKIDVSYTSIDANGEPYTYNVSYYVQLSNVTEDIHLFPLWKEMKSVTIDGNGGQFTYNSCKQNVTYNKYGYMYNQCNNDDSNTVDSITLYYLDNNYYINSSFSTTSDIVGNLQSYKFGGDGATYGYEYSISDAAKDEQLLIGFNTKDDESGTKLSTSMYETVKKTDEDGGSYTTNQRHQFTDGETLYAVWKNRHAVSFFQDEAVMTSDSDSTAFKSFGVSEGSDVVLDTLYSITVTNDYSTTDGELSSAISTPTNKILVAWQQITDTVVSAIYHVSDVIKNVVADLNLVALFKDAKTVTINCGEGVSGASGDAVTSFEIPAENAEVTLYPGNYNGFYGNICGRWSVLHWTIRDIEKYDASKEGDSTLVGDSYAGYSRPGYLLKGVSVGDKTVTGYDSLTVSSEELDSVDLIWGKANTVYVNCRKYDSYSDDHEVYNDMGTHTLLVEESKTMTVIKDEDGDYEAIYYSDGSTGTYSTGYYFCDGDEAAEAYDSFVVNGTAYAFGTVIPVTDQMQVTMAKTGVQAGESATATAEVEVKVPVVIMPSAVSLNTADVVLTPGHTTQLVATIAPANATSTSVSYTSNNPYVATVDANGLVTAKKGGTAVITATTSNGLSTTCKIHVATIKLNASSTKLQVKKSSSSLEVESQTYDKDAISEVTSSNTKVLKTSHKGSKITMKAQKKTGTVTVTVRMTSGATATCKVTVQKGKVVTKNLTINHKKATILKGKTLKLEAERDPITATEKITWSSSNTKVATVNSKGKVTAKGEGKATITAETSNGKKVKCKITVKVPTVKLRKTSGTVKVKKTLQIQIKSTYPANDTVKSYKSSNSKVAKVNSDGTVLGVKKGKATITVTMESGAKAIFKVKVKK